jgi:hypothetical protein
MYPNTWEDGHEHEVLCKLCGVPGEMDDDTKEVFWPAT